MWGLILISMGLFTRTAPFKYAEKLIALKGRENQIFKLALDNRTIRDLIVFMNTEDQFGKDHIDSLGQKLFNTLTDRTTYSLFDEKGRGGQPYELNDTGEYWRSFKATIGNGFIVITSDPFKDGDNLLETYGNNIEGLTEENLQALITLAHEFFIKWYRTNLLAR